MSLTSLLTNKYSHKPEDAESDAAKIIQRAIEQWPDDHERKQKVCEWCCQQGYRFRVATVVWNDLPFQLPEEEIKHLGGDDGNKEIT